MYYSDIQYVLPELDAPKQPENLFTGAGKLYQSWLGESFMEVALETKVGTDIFIHTYRMVTDFI